LKRLVFVFTTVGMLALSVAAGGLFFLPAAYLTQPLEQLSQGRILALHSQGSVWNGSARLLLRHGGKTEPARAAVLPGDLQWQFEALHLLPPALDVRFRGEPLVQQAFSVRFTSTGVQLLPGALYLPAQALEAVGAPFNTLKPGGGLFLFWTEARFGSGQWRGRATMEWRDARSVLSQVVPLGSYRVMLSAEQRSSQLELNSLSGPLLLSGKGQWNNGRWQMSGVARAEPAQRDALAPLMTWLGQPQADGSVQWNMGQK
jgi:general secretion pathway protein N